MTDEMQKEIWVSGFVWQRGYSHVQGTDKRMSPRQKKYVRLSPDDIVISRAELEDMKHSEASEKNGFYCTGYNQAINDILEKE
jgi:hypothetical protein